jgi:hypothetical protein
MISWRSIETEGVTSAISEHSRCVWHAPLTSSEIVVSHTGGSSNTGMGGSSAYGISASQRSAMSMSSAWYTTLPTRQMLSSMQPM